MFPKLMLLLLLFVSPLAWCHKSSDSFVNLEVTGTTIIGRWDIALRDLDYILALDVNNDSAITWLELRSRFSEIKDHVFAHLHIKQGKQECLIQPKSLQVDQHSDGAYAVLNFMVVCARPIKQLHINYQLLFAQDPSHRGLLQLKYEDRSEFIVFSPENQQYQTDFEQSSPWLTFQQFLHEGIWHIWQGYDHILFLLCLLLPAVVIRSTTGWVANDHFSNILGQVGKIVTAFTVAHSITLLLAVFQVISLPSRLVESAIALSVIIVACNNIYPFFRDRAWWVAFAFGLIHGFGFASVLSDLNLSTGNLGLSLLGFNIGVEVGQLAIVLVFLPLAYLLRRHWFYRQIILHSGSLLIILIALVWFVQRAFDLNLNISIA